MNDTARKLGVKTFFRLMTEPEPTRKGKWLKVITDNGVIDICVPAWVRVDRFIENGQTILVAGIPDWLAEKAGLI